MSEPSSLGRFHPLQLSFATFRGQVIEFRLCWLLRNRDSCLSRNWWFLTPRARSFHAWTRHCSSNFIFQYLEQSHCKCWYRWFCNWSPTLWPCYQCLGEHWCQYPRYPICFCTWCRTLTGMGPFLGLWKQRTLAFLQTCWQGCRKHRLHSHRWSLWWLILSNWHQCPTQSTPWYWHRYNPADLQPIEYPARYCS